MFKGPRIRAVGYPQRRGHASRAMRLGVPFFCVVVAIFTAILSSSGYGQAGADFSENFFSENSLALDWVEQPASPPPEGLSTPIELTSEQRAIGLLPTVDFFSSPQTTGNAQISTSQGSDKAAAYPVQSSIATALQQEANDPRLQQNAKDFGVRISEAASKVSPRWDRTLSKNGTVRARGVVGERSPNSVAQGYVGGGVQMTSVYSGSNEYRYFPASFMHIEISDAFRVTHDDGFELVPDLSLPIEIALGLNWREGRLPNETPKGLDVYDMTITTGGELAIALGELQIFADVEKGFWGGNKGLQVESGLKTRYLRLYDEVDVGGRLSVTWADKQSMDREFSVSRSEAIGTGFTVYEAEAGLRDISLSLEAFYYLNKDLGLRAGVDAELLVDSALSSPIVETEGHPLQLRTNIGLIYRF